MVILYCSADSYLMVFLPPTNPWLQMLGTQIIWPRRKEVFGEDGLNVVMQITKVGQRPVVLEAGLVSTRTWGFSEIQLGDQPPGPASNQPVQSMISSSHLSSYLSGPQLIRHVPREAGVANVQHSRGGNQGFTSQLSAISLCDLRLCLSPL